MRALLLTWWSVIMVTLGTACASAPDTMKKGVDWVGTLSIYQEVKAQPSPMHRTVFEMMETCTGLRGDFDTIPWSAARRLVDIEGQLLGGVYFTPGLSERAGDVLLARDQWWAGHVISHEIIHVLLRGDPLHLRPEWACVLR